MFEQKYIKRIHRCRTFGPFDCYQCQNKIARGEYYYAYQGGWKCFCEKCYNINMSANNEIEGFDLPVVEAAVNVEPRVYSTGDNLCIGCEG